MYELNFNGDENNFMLEIYCKKCLLMIQTDTHIRKIQGLQLVSSLAWQYLLVNKCPISDGVLSGVCFIDMGPCSD